MEVADLICENCRDSSEYIHGCLQPCCISTSLRVVKRELGWRDPTGMTAETDNSVVLVSHPGPDKSRSVMRIWFEPDDDYRVRSVKLSMPGRITPTELRRFPWDRWLAMADFVIRDPEFTVRISSGDQQPAW